MWSKEHFEAGSGRRGVARPRKAAAALRRIGRRLVTTLFPGDAAVSRVLTGGARATAPDLCPACSAKIPRTAPPLCRQCGRPLRPMAGGPGGRLLRAQDATCRRCAVEPRYFHAARAPTVYEGAIKDYIHRFKYGGERELGEALGALLGRYLEREPDIVAGGRAGARPVAPGPAGRPRVQPGRSPGPGSRPMGRPAGMGRRVAAGAQDRDADEAVGQSAPRKRAGRVPSRGGRSVSRGGGCFWWTTCIRSGATAEEAARVLLKAGAAQVNVALPGGGRAARGMAGGGVGRMAATNWHSSPPAVCRSVTRT